MSKDRLYKTPDGWSKKSIEDCPFCKKHSGHLQVRYFGQKAKDVVACAYCQAEGPPGSSPEHAIQLWNAGR